MLEASVVVIRILSSNDVLVMLTFAVSTDPSASRVCIFKLAYELIATLELVAPELVVFTRLKRSLVSSQYIATLAVPPPSRLITNPTSCLAETPSLFSTETGSVNSVMVVLTFSTVGLVNGIFFSFYNLVVFICKENNILSKKIGSEDPILAFPFLFF